MLASSPFTAGAAAGFSSCPGGGVSIWQRRGGGGGGPGGRSRHSRGGGESGSGRAEEGGEESSDSDGGGSGGVLWRCFARDLAAVLWLRVRTRYVFVVAGRGTRDASSRVISQKQQVYLFFMFCGRYGVVRPALLARVSLLH